MKWRSADVDLPAAALPQQEFDDPLDEVEIVLGARMVFRENPGLVAGDLAVVPLDPDHERDALCGGRLGEVAQ